MRAENVNRESLIIDQATNIFQTTIQLNLTTRETASDPFLELVKQTTPIDELTPEEQLTRFRLIDKGTGTALRGSALNSGQLIFVGIGTFDNLDDDFIGGEDLAKPFLIEDDAFIYIQLEAQLCGERN